MEELDHDDKDKTLEELAQHHGRPITDLLIEIQEHQEHRGKDLRYIQSLECFYPKSIRKRKRNPSGKFAEHAELKPHTALLRSEPLNAYEERDYVAVSWCWTLSGDEGPAKPSKVYEIELVSGLREQALVRDRVFDRVLAYMSHVGVDLLWIDKYSIPQGDCGDSLNCDHDLCRDKDEGFRVIDLVYKQSNHPLGLLEQVLRNKEELRLLALLRDGTMVGQSSRYRRFWLTKGTDVEDAIKLLHLVHRLTSDDWWKRAWIFQENYQGGRVMTLLLGHITELEATKRAQGFGNVPRELCIDSTNFSYQTTRLCLALRATKGLDQNVESVVGKVLSAAGRYSILLRKSSSMTPNIIADVEQRNISKHWDRLAIIANCCKYSIRLNTPSLRQSGFGISLSTLAMYLLNGELLYNGPSERKRLQQMMSEFLKTQAFSGFCSPGDRHSLTFNKGCRFTDTKLVETGVRTKGHLWELGSVIETTALAGSVPEVDEFSGAFSSHERGKLFQLADELRTFKHDPLAEKLEEFLEQDFEQALDDGIVESSFSQNYMSRMAAELIATIDEGKPLRLGRLLQSSKETKTYSAIFAWEEDSDSSSEETSAAEASPSYVFTSSWPRDDVHDDYDPNDLDRHVSLEVSMTHERIGRQRIPILTTKRWRPGLCFFRGHRRRDVIFHWPSELRGIRLEHGGKQGQSRPRSK